MIVLKSTYNKMVDLFIQEKHGALELWQENNALKQQLLEIQRRLPEATRIILEIRGIL